MSTSIIQNQKSDLSESKPLDDHPFMWLNKWIMYSPMWTRTTIQNNKIVPRNQWIAQIGYYTLILTCIVFWIWDTFQFIYFVGVNLFSLVGVVSMALVNISRLICFYYFFHCFQFYGLPHSHDNTHANSRKDTESTNAGDDHHQTTNVLDVMVDLPSMSLKPSVSSLTRDQHGKLMRKTTIRFKLILCWVIVASLVISVIQIVAFVNVNADALKAEGTMDQRVALGLWQLVFTVIYIYFYQVPLFLAQFVLSIYYVRACAFIKEFTQRIDISVGAGFDTAIQEYSAYRTKFRKEIKVLEYLMMFRLASQLSWIWVDFTMMAEGQSFGGVLVPFLWLSISLWQFVEMVFGGNDATRKFRKLYKKLYRIGTESEYFKEVSVDHSRYLFLLEYVTTYPFVIQILAQEISFRNAAKVTAAFIAARVIAYLLKTGVVSF